METGLETLHVSYFLSYQIEFVLSWSVFEIPSSVVILNGPSSHLHTHVLGKCFSVLFTEHL